MKPTVPFGATAGVVPAVGVLVAATVWGQHDAGRLLWPDVVVGVLACALLPLLLRRPVAGALALAVLAALSPAATPPATVGTLQVAWRRRFPVAVGVGAVGIAAHAVQGLWRPRDGLPFGWWLVLVVAVHAALVGWGALAQARRALLESLRERARRAEAEQGRRVAEARANERTRIAREMHDVLAHRLSLVATHAGALEYRPDAPPEQVARAAGVVRDGVHQALVELREVIGVLRGPADDAGDAPQPVLADLPRLVEESRESGGVVHLRSEVDDPGALPAAAGRTAYRVVQEALTNARRHAAGQPVRVELAGHPGTRLTIDVTNPLPPGPPTPGSPGTGLVGLTERVRLAGGELDHGPTAAGFRVRAWLPWPA
jgi:signal transduction histidine kinase